MQKPIVWGVLAAVALFLAWLMLFRIPTVEEDGIGKFVDPEPEIEAIGEIIAEQRAHAASANAVEAGVNQVAE